MKENSLGGAVRMVMSSLRLEAREEYMVVKEEYSVFTV